MPSRVHIAAFAALLLLAGCFMGFVHNETLVGPYTMIAVDADNEMALNWCAENGHCLGELGGETLFAAGYDDKYVVEAIHPFDDRAATQYFYLIRNPATEDKELGPVGKLKGPFDQSQFDAEKARLHLPDFTRVFDDLK